MLGGNCNLKKNNNYNYNLKNNKSFICSNNKYYFLTFFKTKYVPTCLIVGD